jgi:hypothetical protein
VSSDPTHRLVVVELERTGRRGALGAIGPGGLARTEREARADQVRCAGTTVLREVHGQKI